MASPNTNLFGAARQTMLEDASDLRKQAVELVSIAEPDLCSDDPSHKLVGQRTQIG